MSMSKPMSSAGQPLPCLSDDCATPPKTETAHTHLPHLQRRGSDVCCNCNAKPDVGRMPKRLNHPVWPMHLTGGAAAAGALAIYMWQIQRNFDMEKFYLRSEISQVSGRDNLSCRVAGETTRDNCLVTATYLQLHILTGNRKRKIDVNAQWSKTKHRVVIDKYIIIESL